MADNVRSTWDPFLFEMQGKVQNLFATEAVFLSEIHGVDVSEGGTVQGVRRVTSDDIKNREIFSGRQVRHTVVLANLPGAGFVTETQSWNAPHALSSLEVRIKLVDVIQPVSLSVDVERDSFDHANASAVEGLFDQARNAIARAENFGLLSDGTGKVSDITGGSSPGLTITVGTSANFDVLIPGSVWDIATKSTGANTTGGKRRKIASVSESAGTVTFDTALQASDGDSGNITFSTSEGIFIPGSATATSSAGSLAPQGLEQAAAVTGTFENIDKSTVTQWQGTDGRGGDTTVSPLSAQMLDKAVRRGRRAGLGTWDYGLGDPAAIDLYKQGLYAQVRYEPQATMLKSGYSGIVYDGADKPFPLVKEPAHTKGGIKLIDMDSFTMYGDKVGPAFLDDDGSIFRRSGRTLVKEADLLDRFQMGVTRCNTLVFLNNLAVA